MRHAAVALVLALAACSGTSSKPAEDPSAKPAPKVEAPKPPPAPVAKPAPVDAKPVTLDLTKFKAPSENAELFGWNDGDGKLFYYTAGTIELTANIAADGDYEAVVTASCDEAKGEKAKWTLSVDGQVAGGEQACTSADAKEYRVKVALKAGERKIGLKFLNDLFKEGEYDLNFYVHGVVLKPVLTK
jgi:hypothetical protein